MWAVRTTSIRSSRRARGAGEKPEAPEWSLPAPRADPHPESPVAPGYIRVQEVALAPGVGRGSYRGGAIVARGEEGAHGRCVHPGRGPEPRHRKVPQALYPQPRLLLPLAELWAAQLAARVSAAGLGWA